MRLLSSSALWWLLLAAIIVFFYLLKLKRKRTVVPSVLLWTRALEEVYAFLPSARTVRVGVMSENPFLLGELLGNSTHVRLAQPPIACLPPW